MPETFNRQLMLLELLYENPIGADGSVPAVVSLFKERPSDDELHSNVMTLRALRDDGLVELFEAMGFDGDSAFLTDDGRLAVERIRAKRTNPGARRSAAENGLLIYLHRQDPNGVGWTRVADFLAADDSMFLGVRLPEDLVYRVAEQLVRVGLVQEGITVAELGGAPLTVRLTRDGRECAESDDDVKDFLGHRDRPAPSQNFTINATSGNAFNWGANVSQSVTTTTATGLAGDELKALIQAILEAVPALGLTEEGRREVTASAQAVEGELVRAEPDQGIVRTHLRRILEAVNAEVGSQLGQLLAAQIKLLMAAMGSPID
ncbi:hypothetical protein [Actinoplanes sp. TBRC 11911]|uniref:hypothetical protein n=1 Tax=Actinoplanes sp. TBRC 11911 TaxID=2729386 RepID=UPI0020070D2D|nr:hypothetical protein [Actinoplanes sp. TBRC 11911]